MCLDLLLQSRSVIPGAFWCKGQTCVWTLTHWKTSWECGYFWITADTRKKLYPNLIVRTFKCAAWSKCWKEANLQCTWAERPKLCGGDETWGLYWPKCWWPLQKSQSRVVTVRHAVSCPGVLLNLKINVWSFILSLSLQTKISLQWTYGSLRQRQSLKLTLPEEKFKKNNFF